jgi:hypothetical protein
MALTFAEQLAVGSGDKAFRLYEVTHDGTATTIQAGDLGLTYIEHISVTPKVALSSDATNMPVISGTTSGAFVTILAGLASDVSAIKAWGW